MTTSRMARREAQAKNYKAIADVIRTTLELEASKYPTHGNCLLISIGIADVLTADNANFDHDRFMAACGF